MLRPVQASQQRASLVVVVVVVGVQEHGQGRVRVHELDEDRRQKIHNEKIAVAVYLA